MEKLKKQNQTIKNGWIIKMDKRWTKGLKCSEKAEIEFIVEHRYQLCENKTVSHIVKQWTNAYNHLYITSAGAKTVQIH